MLTKVLITAEEKNRYMKGIISLIKKADKEFVPPLSARDKNSDTELKDCSNNNINDYVESIISNNFIVVINERNKVIGFLSFYPRRVYDIECSYISTIITDAKYRNQGAAKMLYSRIELLSNLPIVVRTWSTNEAHIALLNNMGYNYLEIKKDDRGKGIDTIYFIGGQKYL